MDFFDKSFPLGKVLVSFGERERLSDRIAQSGFFEDQRHFVYGIGRYQWNDIFFFDITEQRDFGFQIFFDGVIGAAHDDVRLDAYATQFFHAVLGRLGLQFVCGADIGQEGDVNVDGVFSADVFAHLPDRLEERQSLNVTDRAAHFDDDDLGVDLLAHPTDAPLDFRSDVGDHLNGLPQIVASTLARDHFGIHLTGGHTTGARQILVDETLVCAQVQVGFRSVVQHENFAMLVRGKSARIDVDVRVQFLCRDGEPSTLQQTTDRSHRNALAHRTDHPAGNENVLGHESPLSKALLPMIITELYSSPSSHVPVSMHDCTPHVLCRSKGSWRKLNFWRADEARMKCNPLGRGSRLSA